MELEYILNSINSENSNISKLIEKIKSKKKDIDTDAVKLYDISNHDVMLETKRPKREVTKTRLGENGVPMVDANGNNLTYKDYQEINRLPLPIQKFVVKQRMNMLLANPIELDVVPNNDVETNLVELLKFTWEKNKVNNELKPVLTKQMSECEVAVILYKEEAEEGYWEGTANKGKTEKIRMAILESDEGEALYPVYNQFSDMVAFGRAYKLTNDETEKDEDHFDLYTSEKNYKYLKNGDTWELVETVDNDDKKIPIVYFSQPKPEYSDIQPLANRKEIGMSTHADANDYSGYPTPVYTAEKIESLPQKDDTGKAIQLLGPDADVKYLERSDSTDSIKAEYDNLKENILMHSGTIDFLSLHSFFGSAPSGYAIKLLFTNCHLFASEKEADFGKGVQRLINLYKSLLCAINKALIPTKNLPIKPVFNYFLPKNIQEELNYIVTAKTNGLLSDETAVIKNPIVEDAEAELEKIKKQKEEKAKEAAKLIPKPGEGKIDNDNKLEAA